MQAKETLLSQSIRSVIKENLSEISLQKIEARLSEKHQMSIPQKIDEFFKFDDVLREFFGAGAENLEKRIITQMLSLEKVQ